MSAKILNAKDLVELAKRVPPNQLKQFEEFRNKTLEYHRRVNSLPDKLRPIDWDHYRRHVRENFVKMVDEFQVKYEELDHSFAKRHEVLDHSKYFMEWQRLDTQVQAEVKQFIEASMERVNVYREELRRLKNLKYENMTLEQFIEARKEAAHLIPGQGKPLFWPHTPEEQLVTENMAKLSETGDRMVNKEYEADKLDYKKSASVNRTEEEHNKKFVAKMDKDLEKK